MGRYIGLGLGDMNVLVWVVISMGCYIGLGLGDMNVLVWVVT